MPSRLVELGLVARRGFSTSHARTSVRLTSFRLGDGADERQLDVRGKPRPTQDTGSSPASFFLSRVFSIVTS
jgi:hypothetical protein